MTLNKKQVKNKYNRFALFYDLFESPIEYFLFKKWRKKYLKNLTGKVLEIGIGTGKNIPYYNYEKTDLIGIDLSPGMLKKAKEKAKKYNYQVTLKLGNMENLPFKSNSFDYVVCTFVLCSVPNPEKAIKEMKRVIKKQGKIILLEHVISQNKLIKLWQRIHNPLTTFLFGFNIDRDTLSNLKKCGLKIKNVKNLALKDVFRKIEVSK